jgi:hypothetical protein
LNLTSKGRKMNDLLLFTALMTMMVLLLPLTTIAIVNPIQAQTGSNSGGAEEKNNSFKVIVNVKGIDPTIAKAQIWITAGNNVTESTTLSNPISLTNSTGSDEGGVLRVEFQFDPGVIKVGNQFKACFKVLEDKDKEGTHFACQTGVNTPANQPEIANIVL